MKFIIKNRKIILCLSLTIFQSAFAHEHQHSQDELKSKKEINTFIVEKINKQYIENIKPIFKNSCMNCHSQNTIYPFYYRVPLVKQWIDNDIQKALEHLDMTNDFPFKGHGSPSKDIEAIENVIQKNTMPPFKYWIFHLTSKINRKEKEKIIQWILQSKQLLEEEDANKKQNIK